MKVSEAIEKLTVLYGQLVSVEATNKILDLLDEEEE